MKPIILNGQDCDGVYIMQLMCDSNTGMIYAGGEGSTMVNGSIYYLLLTIDPKTGSCTAIAEPSSHGIITGWAYDSSSKTQWFSVVSNEGNILRALSVETGKVVASLHTENSLENISFDV